MYNCACPHRIDFVLLFLGGAATHAQIQTQSKPINENQAAPKPSDKPSATGGLRANIEGQIDMPLRYRIEGRDFVIDNGAEFFNRPLYGGHSAFRIDGGDKPEFSIYLPGRGGNARLGIRTKFGVKWLNDAQLIRSRYRPGALLYTITDPLLGPKGQIDLEVLAYHNTEGLIIKAIGKNLAPNTDLIVGYGGGNGQRGARDGDIGTERVPISQYFQFKPEFAVDDHYTIEKHGFVVKSKVAQIRLLVSNPVEIRLADANHWADLGRLLSADPDPRIKIALAIIPIQNSPLYVSFDVLNQVKRAELKVYQDVTTRGSNEVPKPETLKSTLDLKTIGLAKLLRSHKNMWLNFGRACILNPLIRI